MRKQKYNYESKIPQIDPTKTEIQKRVFDLKNLTSLKKQIKQNEKTRRNLATIRDGAFRERLNRPQRRRRWEQRKEKKKL